MTNSTHSTRGGDGPRLFRRGPCENAAAVAIGAGILLQLQPFALELYTWSFAVILAGTVGFLIASHLPE